MSDKLLSVHVYEIVLPLDPGAAEDIRGDIATLEARVAAMREATQPLLDAYLRARGEPGLVYIAPYMSALELTLRQAAAKDGST